MPREALTSRERVVRTLNRQPVDRVPIDLGVQHSSGISAFAYWNLREHLGLSTDRIEIIDMIQVLARVDEDILERFHIDTMLLQAPWPATHRWRARGKYEFTIPTTCRPQRQDDGMWVVQRNNATLRMPAGGFFFDGGWPSFYDGPMIDEIAREAERIYKETPYATIFIAFGAYFSEYPDWLMRIMEEPEKVIEENQRQCEQDMKLAAEVIEKMGRYVQAIVLVSDLGMQTGPFCRPSLYERISAPFVKRLCDFIHRNSDCKTWLHCCGAIKPLIPILIDCGIDVLNPVQISGRDMEPERLKAEFGDKLVFWGGGCDTQRVLPTGTPQQVAQNVRELMRVFKPGGGFVFNQVHNVMGDVPPENVVAMLETAYAESFYGAVDPCDCSSSR